VLESKDLQAHRERPVLLVIKARQVYKETQALPDHKVIRDRSVLKGLKDHKATKV